MSQNIFAEIPDELPTELFDQLASGSEFSLKRIVSRGHCSDWYDQESSEWVILLKGSATIEFEEEKFTPLHPGDYLHIPAHTRHRVSGTDPNQDTIWLALYYRDS